jgi:TRAP-type mannitol/chloroaromatic compound transport system permease large subunit
VALFALFMARWRLPNRSGCLRLNRNLSITIDWAKLLSALLPPLVLIFLVLGTIFIGLATPTEAGAMGAAGALVVGH